MTGSPEILATGADRIHAGWAALGRGAWEEAQALFEAALADTETPTAVEGLSWAAWWLNDAPLVFAARERAYRLYQAAGDPAGAARMATWLGTDHVDFRGEFAVGRGWLARARRLLLRVEDGIEHGWLCVHEAEKHLMLNDTARARELGSQAAEVGRRLGVVDLEMSGIATEGLALVTDGKVPEGMSRLDEAAAAALGDQFRERWSVGWCCCYLIYGCERVRDYERAAQWCRQAEEWSARMRTDVLNRACRAHYAGVLIWSGGWTEAEAVLVGSAEQLAVIRPPMAAEAVVRLGELRRRQGHFDEAMKLFEQVADHPLAVLGLGELRLDRGDPAGARDRAEEYLRDVPPRAGTVRASGLELLVRAAVALGEPRQAAVAAEEIGHVATRVSTEPLMAAARYASGVVAAATGDAERARTAFEDAARLFQRSGAPFEAARARTELARVLSTSGRARDAAREARAAATSLGRIGAAYEAAHADALAREAERRPAAESAPLTPREREVLRLVARGHSDRAVADILVISEHTVHRHVANILAKLRCRTRCAAVAEALTRDLI